MQFIANFLSCLFLKQMFLYDFEDLPKLKPI